MKVQKLPYDVLQHHGIKGQRWGVRHQQYSDNLPRKKRQKKFFTKNKAAIGGAGFAVAFTGAILARKYLIKKASKITLGSVAKATLATGSKAVTSILGSPLGALALPILTVGAVYGVTTLVNNLIDKNKY